MATRALAHKMHRIVAHQTKHPSVASLMVSPREGITTRNAAYATRIMPKDDIVIPLSKITAKCINCTWAPCHGLWRLKYKSSICPIHGRLECI